MTQKTERIMSDNMEKIFFDLEYYSFVVHLTNDMGRGKLGHVYPINRYIGTDEWAYESSHDGGGIPTEDGATCLFSFSFCWRGCWDDSIHFEDYEYNSEQLPIINDLWLVIEQHLKAMIKEQYPENTYDE